jgi:small subunit ribosomal protein S6e
MVTKMRQHAGQTDIPGLTDEFKPRQRGPKRASKIMKLFNIPKGSDHPPIPTYTKKYARETESNGKKHVHRPKVQRLVTPLTLQRKRRRINLRKKQIDKVRGLVSLTVHMRLRGA